jgi:lipid-binding SYLF domain-containing protein
MHHHRTLAASLLICFGLALVMGGCATAKGSSPAEKRNYALDMAEETLDQLYAQRPEAQEKVRNAAGYGVFSNIGTNIIFVSTGGGYGVVHNNQTGEETFMKMGEVGVGLGLGVKDFRAVFVFHDDEVLEKFVDSGWEWGGEADAAAKSGDQGGAASAAGNVNSGIEVYQFTEAGIALSATVSGTRYWPDKELN